MKQIQLKIFSENLLGGCSGIDNTDVLLPEAPILSGTEILGPRCPVLGSSPVAKVILKQQFRNIRQTERNPSNTMGME